MSVDNVLIMLIVRQSLFIRRQLRGLEKQFCHTRWTITAGDKWQQVQYDNVNTTQILLVLHVCKQQSQYKLIAPLYVLSLWEQIGENPTCQNCTLCQIFQFLLFIFCIRLLEALAIACPIHSPPINILCKQSPLCCNVLYLVHGLFLQLLEFSRLGWALLTASRL